MLKINYPIVLTMALAISLSACSVFKKNQPKSSGSEAQMELGNGTIGIKNVSQVAASMAAVTGVAMNATYTSGTGGNQSLATQATTIAPWLSTDGNIETVNSSMLLSITGLAGGFCKAMISKDAAISDASASSRKVHQKVKFSLPPKQALTDEVQEQIIAAYTQLFLRRDPTDEEKAILIEAIKTSIDAVGTPPNNPSANINVLLVPCTAVLSSLDFLKA